MSHPGSVDIFDFILLTIYPVIGLFVIEIISRLVKVVPSWVKLSIQGITMIVFAIMYIGFMPLIATSSDEYIHAEPHWLSSFVLIALSVTLFYQARRSKIDPKKSDY
jgi:putative Mn2+ efflux pump MntP